MSGKSFINAFNSFFEEASRCIAILTTFVNKCEICGFLVVFTTSHYEAVPEIPLLPNQFSHGNIVEEFSSSNLQ